MEQQKRPASDYAAAAIGLAFILLAIVLVLMVVSGLFDAAHRINYH